MIPSDLRAQLSAELAEMERDAGRYAELSSPEIVDFLKAIEHEALHQRDRWETAHDVGKTAVEWMWLIAVLATKATQAERYGDPEKYLHHIVTTAAACLNWHANAMGAHKGMRPSAAPMIDAAMTKGK